MNEVKVRGEREIYTIVQNLLGSHNLRRSEISSAKNEFIITFSLNRKKK